MGLARFSTFLAGTALAAAQAHAAPLVSQTSADFRDVHIAAIDLTPGDGIAGGYSVQQVFGYHNAGAWGGPAYAHGDNVTSHFSELSAFNFTATQAQLYANVQRPGGFGDLHSAASYSSSEPHAAVSADSSNHYEIAVQPHTALTLSGQLLLTLTQSGSREWSWGSSSGLFSADGWMSGANGCGFSVTAAFNSTFPAQASYAPYNFSCTYTNNSDSVVKTDAYMDVRSYVSSFDPSVPPPVPEPAAYMMLGAGALLLGARARRRQRR